MCDNIFFFSLYLRRNSIIIFLSLQLRKKQQNRREMKALKVVEKEKCKHTSNLHESRTDKNGCSPPDGLVFYDQHYGISDDVNSLGASASADWVNSSTESETAGENVSNEPRESVETSGISQEEENDSGDEDFVPNEETDTVLCEEGDAQTTEQPAANATKGSDERECSTQENGKNFDNCCAALNSSSLAMPEHALNGQTEGELSNSSVENGQSPGQTDERIKSRIKNSSWDESFSDGSESCETRSRVGPVSTDEEMVSAAWTCHNKDTSVGANSGSELMDHNDKTLLLDKEKTIKHVNIEYGSNENHPNGITKEDLVQNESSENTCETLVLRVAGGDNSSPSVPDGTPYAAEPVGTVIHSVETTDIQGGFPGCPVLADKGTDSHCASCVCDEQCDYTTVSSPRVLELVLKICSGHKVNEEEVGEANKFSRICLSGWHLQCENGSWFVVEQRARQVDNHTLSSAVKVHLSDRLEAFFNNEDKLWTVVENEHVHDEHTVLTSEIRDQDLKDTFTVTESSSADQDGTPEELVVTPILSQSNSWEDLNVKLLDSKVNDDGTGNPTKVKGPKPVGVYADVARSRTESSSHEALHAAIQGIFLHIFELGESLEEALDYSRHTGLVDSVCSPLCSALRNILSTGLRKKLIGKYTLWNIVEELKDVSGDINMTVNWVNNRYACLSDAQKFQVFVYECLNIGRGTLHHWLEKFIRQNKTRSNGKQGNKFYNHDGIVFQLSREKLEEMVLDLSRISDLPFKIHVESWINNQGVGLHETAFTFE